MPSKRAVRHPRPRQWDRWSSLLSLLALGSSAAHASAPPGSARVEAAASPQLPAKPSLAPKAGAPEPTPAPRRPLFAPPLSATNPTRVASYTLEARLDENEHRINAKGRVTWTNTSTVATSELYFHLYLNAFKNDRTRFLRSPFTGSRSARQLGRPGSVTVTRLSSQRFDGENLWARADKHSPGDADDATDIRLPLPEPVAPGETLSFDIEFTADLPEIVERTGFARSFHLVAQWFPKLAKLERNGEWAHFSFHPHAEFYADFGDYDVTLDVPESFVVGATGRRITSRAAGDRRIDHFQASGVLDFAWTAWDGFDVSHRRIEGVDVELLVPRGSGPAASVSWGSLEHALPFFNRHFGSYPYPTLTVVFPPSFAGAAGGMEYPSFITTGGSPLWTWIGARTIEQVTVHELGHQWFQSLVATNEARYPFLDEGLNSYAEWITLEDRFGAASIGERFGLAVSLPAVGRWAALAYGKDEAIALSASEFTGMRALGGVVYARTAAALSTLGNVYGEEKLTRAMSDYTARYRFASPTPNELLYTIGDDVSAEAAAALRKMLFERGWVDYAVRDLDSRSVQEGRFKSRVVVVRRGTLSLPVTVRFSLANGEIIDRTWSGAEPTTVLELEHGAPLLRVTVDPEQKVLLDENRMNDTRRMSGSKRNGRTAERSVYWAELLLHLLGP